MFASLLNSIKYLDPVQHVKPAENLRSGILSGILDNAKKIPLIGQMLGSNENTSIESNLAQNEQNESDITKENGENTTFESMIGILTNIDRNIQILVSNENKDENLENSIPEEPKKDENSDKKGIFDSILETLGLKERSEEPKKDENSDKKGIFEGLIDSFSEALGLNRPTQEKSEIKTTGSDEEVLAEMNANDEITAARNNNTNEIKTTGSDEEVLAELNRGYPAGQGPYTLEHVRGARNNNTNEIRTTGSDEEVLAELNRGYPAGEGPYTLEHVRGARKTGSNTNEIRTTGSDEEVLAELNRGYPPGGEKYTLEHVRGARKTGSPKIPDIPPTTEAEPTPEIELKAAVEEERAARAAPRQRTALDIEVDRERAARAAPRQRTALDIEVDRERAARAAPRQRTALDDEIQVTREWWNYGFDAPPSKEQVNNYLTSQTTQPTATPKRTSNQNPIKPKVDVSTLKPGTPEYNEAVMQGLVPLPQDFEIKPTPKPGTPEYDEAVMQGKVPLPQNWGRDSQGKMISSRQTEKSIDRKTSSKQESAALRMASKPTPRPTRNPSSPMKASYTGGYDSNMVGLLDDLDTEFFKIVYTNYAVNATYLERA